MTRAEHGGRHLGGAAAAAHRVLSRLPAASPEVRCSAASSAGRSSPSAAKAARPYAANGPREATALPSPVPISASAAALRHGAPQRLSGERARVNSRPGAGLAEPHRRRPSRADGRSSSPHRRRQKPWGRRWSAACSSTAMKPSGRQPQAGLGEPRRGARLGHPQRLIEFDPPAVGAGSARRARPARPRCRREP